MSTTNLESGTILQHLRMQKTDVERAERKKISVNPRRENKKFW